MRENMGLYRGKRTKDGVWIEGPLVFVEGKPAIYDHNAPDSSATWSYGEAHLWGCSEVDPETVGQFIGLTDKNGKMIFEGDIIETKGCRWVIGFENTAFAAMDGPDMQFAMFEQYIWDHKKREWAAPDYWEVVGNIHDNPELLEVK